MNYELVPTIHTNTFLCVGFLWIQLIKWKNSMIFSSHKTWTTPARWKMSLSTIFLALSKKNTQFYFMLGILLLTILRFVVILLLSAKCFIYCAQSHFSPCRSCFNCSRIIFLENIPFIMFLNYCVYQDINFWNKCF